MIYYKGDIVEVFWVIKNRIGNDDMHVGMILTVDGIGSNGDIICKRNGVERIVSPKQIILIERPFKNKLLSFKDKIRNKISGIFSRRKWL